MTKIDIFSGFLGAGKTTLIKKLISEVFAGEKVVLIENEFGDIAIDGGFLQDAGVVINEMNSGCICCSLVGDFRKALHKVLEELHPDRILIEPSGVGKLSDVIRAVQAVSSDDVVLNSFTTVADAKKCKMYMKNFGEFYNDQIEHANCIVLSRTANMAEDKIEEVVAMLREHNQVATIITTDWEKVTGQQIVEAMEHTDTLEEELEKLAKEAVHEHHHHHHHHDGDECDDEECECQHHHHDDDDEDEEHEHHHHHHDDDDEDEEHEHHHHHDDDDEDEEHEHHHHHHHHDGEECDDEECECHHHHHDDDDEDEEHEHHHHHHHHDHDADEIFTSWGMETSKTFTQDEIKAILAALGDEAKYGIVLRAKGIVAGKDGEWIHFDYVPEETSVRTGSAIVRGRFCVIGSELKEKALKELFL
ncbi:MAG: GTP-binding protein [Lachnospiraceae bacterium]|nr:GTP-binding protein [Lachnospiraceae bacterium]